MAQSMHRTHIQTKTCSLHSCPWKCLDWYSHAYTLPFPQRFPIHSAQWLIGSFLSCLFHAPCVSQRQWLRINYLWFPVNNWCLTLSWPPSVMFPCGVFFKKKSWSLIPDQEQRGVEVGPLAVLNERKALIWCGLWHLTELHLTLHLFDGHSDLLFLVYM